MVKYSTSETPKFSPHLCPQCKAKIPSYEGEQAEYIACGSCCSYFKLENTVLVKYLDYKRKVNVIIPIGTKAEYKGKKYQVVGALQVKESNASYYWTEYILKADDGTYDYVSEYQGHWSFVKELENFKRAKQTTTFSYKEKDYTYFSFYKTMIVGAVGEFTRNLSLDGKPTVKEYIAPPYGLNHEYGTTIDTWYETEYISKNKVREIFNLPNFYLPYKSGGYSTEPFPLQIDTYELKRYAVIFSLAMIAIVFLAKVFSNERESFNASIPIHNTIINSDSNNYVSDDFQLSSLTGSSAVDVRLISYVSNTWLDVSFSMINQQNGQEYFFEEGVEFYSGYEGGYHWTEGNIEKNITLSEIPDGTYRITSKPLFKEGTSVPNSFDIRVTQGVTLWSNFIILTLLGLLMPIVIGIWESNFNTNKWSTSNLIEHE